MRDIFREWYLPDATERASLLGSATISLDTNVLLLLYRLSSDDRARVLDLFDAVKNRIWVSHQAAYEYQVNRLDAYTEQIRAYDNLRASVHKLKNQLVDSVKAHPVLSSSSIRGEFEDRLNSLEQYITERQNADHPIDLREPIGEDGVRNALDQLLAGRVGVKPAETDERTTEARRRMAAKIPPGFEDGKKPEPRCFGDYFLWDEVLAHVESLGDLPRPLILITEETKPDWWELTAGREIIGPRRELFLEAKSRGVTPIWLMSLRRFFKAMATELMWPETELGEYSPVEHGADAAEPQRTES